VSRWAEFVSAVGSEPEEPAALRHPAPRLNLPGRRSARRWGMSTLASVAGVTGRRSVATRSRVWVLSAVMSATALAAAIPLDAATLVCVALSISSEVTYVNGQADALTNVPLQ
jgi:hypothetical protein